MEKIVLCLLLTLNISCSSLSEKQKKYAIIGGAALVAGSIGALATPSGENKGSHAALWAGVGSSLAGLYVINKYDKSDDYKELASENLKLKVQLEKGKQILIKSGDGLLGSKLPSKVEGLVSPGGWKLYKISRWVKDEDNANVFFHQNEMLEIEPPSIGGSE